MTPPIDAWGWLASACVLAAYLMREMRPLRLMAIASNLAFLVYAAELELMPVLLLHAVLLPVNLWRLYEGELRSPAGWPAHGQRMRAALHPIAAPLPAALLVAGLAALFAALPLRCAQPSGAAPPGQAREVRPISAGTVLGTVSLPVLGPPAGLVLLLPDGPVYDPRSAAYVEELLRNRLAALDVMHGGEDPAAVAAALPALHAQSGTTGLPVGVLGFGAGGRDALDLGPGIAARVLLYPGCAGLAAAPSPAGNTLLLHGEADPANPPADCAALAERLDQAGAARRIAYRAAGYAWDYPRYVLDRRVYLPRPDGQGLVAVDPWPPLARMSASQAAEFLAAALAGVGR